MIAKIMVPETGTPETMGAAQLEVPRLDVNVIDAAARGASEGLQLALNVGAMLIAFVALVAMGDRAAGLVGGCSATPTVAGAHPRRRRWRRWPGVMGVPWKEAPFVGELLGTKTVLNEFLAYQAMASHAALLCPAASASPASRCAASPTSARWPSCSAAWAAWSPNAGRPGPPRAASIIAGSLATFLTGTIAGLVGG